MQLDDVREKHTPVEQHYAYSQQHCVVYLKIRQEGRSYAKDSYHTHERLINKEGGSKPLEVLGITVFL